MPMMIAFDQLIYKPGSIVSGHVIIVRKSQQKVKGLTLRFYGRRIKVINDGESGLKQNKKDKYFDDKIDIFGHDGQDTVLKIGESLFPFSFTLPSGLPSSFVWNRGQIMYIVEARLTRSSWKDDKKASSRFTVEGVYDLNLDPVSTLPVSIQKSKYIQHLLSKSGPFAFSLSTAKSGWIRGHSLLFHLEMKNLSKVDTKRVKVALVQEVVQDGKQWSLIIQEVRGPLVPSGEIQSWDARLKIPENIPPTNLGNVLNYSPGLAMNYFLQIEMSPKATGVEGLSAKVPIVIGTVPLIRRQMRALLHSHEDSCPMNMNMNMNMNTSQRSLSQFSPMSLQPLSLPSIHSQPYHFTIPCRTCRRSGGRNQDAIYRRLRNLQRRRESPPPTYDEVVNNQGQTNSGQDQSPQSQNDKVIHVASNCNFNPVSQAQQPSTIKKEKVQDENQSPEEPSSVSGPSPTPSTSQSQSNDSSHHNEGINNNDNNVNSQGTFKHIVMVEIHSEFPPDFV